MSENFLLEIGTEEIPAGYLAPASLALKQSFSAFLSDSALSALAVITTYTPRRIVLFAEVLPKRQPDRSLEVQGPPARIAYDAENKPTKAALGFARTNSVPVDSLTIRHTPSGDYVVAVRQLPGRNTVDLLADALPSLISAIPFPKSMHWDVSAPYPSIAPPAASTAPSSLFARPIRSLLCLFGPDVVPFTLDGLKTSRYSLGHPFLSPDPVEIPRAHYEDFCTRLRKAHVIVDAHERKALVRRQIETLLSHHGSPFTHESLLDEVTNLVEFPSALEGSFEPIYLTLPDDVIVTAMTEHQRYFPVRDPKGKLLPRFVTVSNRTDAQADQVRRGNERVLAARLNDADFFWNEDRKTPLADKVAKLDHVTFQEKLGTYGQRTQRVEALADFIAEATGQSPDARALVRRAAHLSKADLVTHMVYEFTSLQGIMGTHYALADNEPGEVAAAIAEHYRPRSASDDLPQTLTGSLVALADKFDTLTACFSVGLIPTGSQDPYGLRRAAQGIIRIITSRKFTLLLTDAINFDLKNLPAQPDTASQVMAFLKDRLYQHALDSKAPHELIRAALEPGFDDLSDFSHRLDSLVELSKTPDWNRLVIAAERTHNITRDFTPKQDIDESLLTAPEELRLFSLYNSVHDRIVSLLDQRDYLAVGKLYEETFAEPLHTFFEKVFVNVDDLNLRNNRLTLLKSINSLYSDRVADLSQVPKRD